MPSSYLFPGPGQFVATPYGNAMVDQNLSEEHAWERPIGQLSAEAIREYKEIYKAEFGVELSDTEAEKQGLRLLRLFALLLPPLPNEPEK